MPKGKGYGKAGEVRRLGKPKVGKRKGTGAVPSKLGKISMALNSIPRKYRKSLARKPGQGPLRRKTTIR